MARIGKTMIMNVIENEIKKDSDVVYDGNIIGKISTRKGEQQEIELYIKKFYKRELVKEAELLLTTFGVVFDRSVRDEEHVLIAYSYHIKMGEWLICLLQTKNVWKKLKIS